MTAKELKNLRNRTLNECARRLRRLEGVDTAVLARGREAGAAWPHFLVRTAAGAVVWLLVNVSMPGAADDLLAEDGVESDAARLRTAWGQWCAQSPGAELAHLLLLCPDRETAAAEGVVCLAGEQCQAPALAALLGALAPSSLADDGFVRMRAFLSPEDETMSARPTAAALRISVREQQLSLLPRLLDFDQSRCVKEDLWLPDEAHEVAAAPRVRLVTGAAGTGKSVVLIHRAALLAEENPGGRILVLTHNRGLREDLEARYHRLETTRHSGGGMRQRRARVEFLTFYQWLKRWLPQRRGMLSGWERERFVAVPARGNFTAEFLLSEFDWIHDQGIASGEEYFEARRTGRGLGLTRPRREICWDALVEYRRKCLAEGKTDWNMRACRAAQEVQRVPQNDVVLVDEAQFFARTWLVAVVRAVRPGGQLFLCADPAQGFLGRGQSWREAGIDVTGNRAVVLRRPYRNTQEIQNYATRLYSVRTGEDAEAPRLCETTDLSGLPHGESPQVIHHGTPQDEVSAVVRQVDDLLAGGVTSREVLVLCARRHQVNVITERLRKKHGPRRVGAPGEWGLEADRIMVCTIDMATGLERPVVIVSGIGDMLEREGRLNADETARREERRLNSSRLYMAMTRATQRLVIFSTQPLPPEMAG